MSLSPAVEGLKDCLELLEEAGVAQSPAIPAVVSGTLPVALGAVCDPSVMKCVQNNSKGCEVEIYFLNR